MNRRLRGFGAFAGAAIAGGVVAWHAERQLVGAHRFAHDPEWQELQRPLPVRSRRVESFDGTMLSVEELGPADGPVLVLGHGYGMSQRCWHYQRRDLADEFRVVSWDQRGHGGSEPSRSGTYDVATLGRDLGAVLDAVLAPGEQAIVAGHSMGGMAVLSYAEQFPERLEKLAAGVVLLDTAEAEILAGGLIATGVAALGAVQRRTLEALFALVGRGPRYADRLYAASSDLSYLITRGIGLSPDASAAHVAFVEQMWLSCPNPVIAALGPALTALDLRDAPRCVRVPALVLVGEHDRLTPAAQSRRLARLLPDAELVELPGVGHTTPVEAHEAVTAHLRGFARRLLAQEGSWPSA